MCTRKSEPRTGNCVEPSAHRFLAEGSDKRPSAQYLRPNLQPIYQRARGGKLVAQRYRQRTPAMAAGRTNRRWTAREVLSCPLPPVPA